MQGDADIGQTTTSMGIGELESNEIRRFELLRNELMELEKRVQKSTDQYENEEVCLMLFNISFVTFECYNGFFPPCNKFNAHACTVLKP
jgi:hypothetical protein